MQLNQTGDRTAAVKILVGGVLALAVAIGLLMPLPDRSKPEPTHSQIPTLEVGKG
jgi:hypothetical protein